MKNDAFYIARYQTFGSLISKLPIEREKISPRNLLMIGFIDDSLKEMFDDEFARILPTIPPSQKLTFAEQTSYNNYFAQNPEKVAGFEKKTTSIQFPVKTVGDKELIIKTIRNGMKKDNNNLTTQNSEKPKYKVGDVVKGKTWDILGTVDAIIKKSAHRPICYVLKNARGSDYAISYFKESITGQVVVDEFDLELRFKENILNVEKVLWAVKKGEPDWKEEIITNKEENIEAAKNWAKSNGFDRFRESIVTDEAPEFNKSLFDLSKQSTTKPKFNTNDSVKIVGTTIEGVVLKGRTLSGKFRYLINALKGGRDELLAYDVTYKDNQKLIFVFESKLEPINKVSDEEKNKKLKLLKLKLKLQTQTLLLKQRQ